MCFPNYPLRKIWLDNCLERLVSEDILTGNMLNGLKQI